MEAMRKQAAQLAAAQHEPAIRRSVQEASKLSSKLWNDPRCRQETDGLVRLLLQPEMLDLFAIHEAGHEIYYRRAGWTTFIFDSPRIIYNERNENPFTEQRARIRPGDYVQPEGDDWLLKLARGYAAGGRCSLRLTTTNYAGDIKDRESFDEMYTGCYLGVTVDKKDIDKMWLDAQGDINVDLDDEGFQAQIKARAQEIKPQLFPWLRAQCNRQ